MNAPLRTVELPDGARVPALGMGTWHMGEDRAPRKREVAALRAGLDLGITLIDTAEMYGDGGAEEVVGTAVTGRRDEVFIVSKVYPHKASAKGMPVACERSLHRLRTDRIDCYLLHWRGRVPLAETIEAFERLRSDGKIARWGVSNFDVDDMAELLALPQGARCATNQVLYNIAERAAEWRLLPLLREHRIPLMAYSPLGQGELLRDHRLAAIAQRAHATPAQLALAWTLRHRDVVAIPQSSDPTHIGENRRAVDLTLDASTLRAIDDAFPPPRRATRLSVI
jgi:diketogulonate reductase-like aldo/keto reductase